MPRTKGSKNRLKTTHTDYTSQIAEKQEAAGKWHKCG